jgi:hypothetical protein
MPATPDASSIAETIAGLAEEIARTSPECARTSPKCTDKALKIIELARSLSAGPDRALIEDAIESKVSEDELSDSRVQTITSAVTDALRDDR